MPARGLVVREHLTFLGLSHAGRGAEAVGPGASCRKSRAEKGGFNDGGFERRFS